MYKECFVLKSTATQLFNHLHPVGVNLYICSECASCTCQTPCIGRCSYVTKHIEVEFKWMISLVGSYYVHSHAVQVTYYICGAHICQVSWKTQGHATITKYSTFDVGISACTLTLVLQGVDSSLAPLFPSQQVLFGLVPP